MSARIVRLAPRRVRLQEAQAADLRQLVLALPGLPTEAVRAIVRSIDRQTAAAAGWTFVMLSPEQNRAVVGWLRRNSVLPAPAMVLWAEVFQHLDFETGEILASRQELAAAAEMQPDDVSRIMTELVKLGAISRRRVAIHGVRGMAVRYFLNPRVGTHLAGKGRDDAQAAAAELRLV